MKKYFNKEVKIKKITFPIVLKPINEGSSLGVKICKNLQDLKIIKKNSI